MAMVGVQSWFRSVLARYKSNGYMPCKNGLTWLAAFIKRSWCSMLPFLSRFGRLFHVPDVRQAFRVTFRNPLASAHVLPDLAEFCYAHEAIPEGWTDPFSLGRWVGRHDVWLRIREYLDLTDEEIHDIRRGQSVLRDGATNAVE